MIASENDYQSFEVTKARVKGTVSRRGVDVIFNFSGLFTCGVQSFITDWDEGTYAFKGNILPITAREDAEINDLLGTRFQISNFSVGTETKNFATFIAEFTMPMRESGEGNAKHDRNWNKYIGNQEVKEPYWVSAKELPGLSPSARELYRILSLAIRRTLKTVDCQDRSTQDVLNRTNILFKRAVNRPT